MKIVLCFFIIMSSLMSSSAQVEQDPRHHSNVSVAYFLSPTYLQSNLRYSYKSPLILKRFHARLDVEAFHLSSESPFFLVGNYNRFDFIADVNVPFSKYWSMFPFGGIQLVADLTHIKQAPNSRTRAGVAGVVGVEWMATKGRFIFQLMYRWTIYRNGAWQELRPQIGVDIWKGLGLHVGGNFAVAIGRPGLDGAIYPHIGINYFIPLPQKKKEKKKE